MVLDGDTSREIPVSSGVPQGSVLDLILFYLYINDLPDNIHSNVHLFADDTAVYLVVQCQEDKITSKLTYLYFKRGKGI